MFSTFATKVIPLDEGEREVWADIIANRDRIYGATYVEQAMYEGLELWEANTTSGYPIVDKSRSQFTYLITDGNIFHKINLVGGKESVEP